MFGYRDLMITLALQHEWRAGVLLGVGSGSLLWRFLTEVPSVHVVGVDHFVRRERKRRVMRMRDEHLDRCVVHSMRTSQAVSLVEDASLDFLFLDAGRKYGCVRSDIRLWWGKVKEGGWFGGRAYEEGHPGVVLAVNDRFGSEVFMHGYTVWSVVKS